MAPDPRWPNAREWLAGAPATEPTCGVLQVLGLPVRAGAVTPGRCDLAPAAIRAALTRIACHDLATGTDLSRLSVRDHGDLALSGLPLPAMHAATMAALPTIVATGDATLLLGGNDAITRPAGLAVASRPDRCGLLTFDAHLDLRDLDQGPSNGNPVRALLLDGVQGPNIVELGLQPFANSAAYSAVAHAAGIETVAVADWRARGIAATVVEALDRLAARAEAVHVDVDLDVLDRAFAPAAPGSRPGGLLPAELFEAVRVCGRHRAVRSLGIVECDPERDVADATVLAGALCAVHFAAGLVERLVPR